MLHGTENRGVFWSARVTSPGLGSSRRTVGASGRPPWPCRGADGGGVTHFPSTLDPYGSPWGFFFLKQRRGCKKKTKPNHNLPHSCSRAKLLKSRSHSETLPALQLCSQKASPSAVGDAQWRRRSPSFPFPFPTDGRRDEPPIAAACSPPFLLHHTGTGPPGSSVLLSPAPPSAFPLGFLLSASRRSRIRPLPFPPA